MARKERPIVLDEIEACIREIRGQRVMLDQDLARLYGVETRALVQAVKRNRARFPEDFVFRLTKQDVMNLKSQSVISSSWGGRRRSTPYAFTEYGAVMLANVLRSDAAIHMSVYVVRAFIRTRQTFVAQAQLAEELGRLRRAVAAKFQDYDERFRLIIETIEQFLNPLRRAFSRSSRSTSGSRVTVVRMKAA